MRYYYSLVEVVLLLSAYLHPRRLLTNSRVRNAQLLIFYTMGVNNFISICLLLGPRWIVSSKYRGDFSLLRATLKESRL